VGVLKIKGKEILPRGIMKLFWGNTTNQNEIYVFLKRFIDPLQGIVVILYPIKWN